LSPFILIFRLHHKWSCKSFTIN